MNFSIRIFFQKCLPISTFSTELSHIQTVVLLSLILWSQILLRNISENFRPDIPHSKLVLKSDNENSHHFLSGIWAISEVQRSGSISYKFCSNNGFFQFPQTCWVTSPPTSKWQLTAWFTRQNACRPARAKWADWQACWPTPNEAALASLAHTYLQNCLNIRHIWLYLQVVMPLVFISAIFVYFLRTVLW